MYLSPEAQVLMLVGFIVSAAVCGVVGSLIGLINGRTEIGFWLGFLLGPLGWVITYLLSDWRPRCQECLGAVPLQARKCQHCGSELPALARPAGAAAGSSFDNNSPSPEKAQSSGSAKDSSLDDQFLVIFYLIVLAAIVLAVLFMGKSNEPNTSSSDRNNPSQYGAEFSASATQGMNHSEINGPVVQITTSHGVIEVELFEKQMPSTVANFLRHVDSGHYDQLIFHRVTADLIQGGGVDQNLKLVRTNSPIRNESFVGGPMNLRGTIAMARYDDPHSASNQFFINLSDNPHYDTRAGQFGYCVFGKVREGMDVADAIGRLPRRNVGYFDGLTHERVIIQSVRRKM